MVKRKKKSAEQKRRERADLDKKKRQKRKERDDDFLKQEAERVKKYKPSLSKWPEKIRQSYKRTAYRRSKSRNQHNLNNAINNTSSCKNMEQPWKASRRKRVRREAKTLRVLITKKDIELCQVKLAHENLKADHEKLKAEHENIREHISQLSKPARRELYKRMIPEGQKSSLKAASVTKVSRNYYTRNKKQVPHVTAKLTKQKVIDFLMDPSNSTCLPGKNDVVKVGKGVGNKKRIYILNDTMYNLYTKYITVNKSKISLSNFQKCRPNNIKLVDYRKLDTCLCHRHQNMQLKVDSLSCVGLNKKIGDVMRTYTDDELKVKLSEINTTSEIKFEEWNPVKSVTKAGKDKTEWKLQTVSLGKDEFITKFMNGMMELRKHSYRVTCILENIKELTQNLAEGEVILHMDFSRNYECVPLGETQEHFFNRPQVTLHPMVIYYKNDEDKLHHKSYTGVSDTRDHTAVEVITFCRALIKKYPKK